MLRCSHWKQKGLATVNKVIRSWLLLENPFSAKYFSHKLVPQQNVRQLTCLLKVRGIKTPCCKFVERQTYLNEEIQNKLLTPITSILKCFDKFGVFLINHYSKAEQLFKMFSQNWCVLDGIHFNPSSVNGGIFLGKVVSKLHQLEPFKS